jgi:nucleoside-diphosphate-sugar epimerase
MKTALVLGGTGTIGHQLCKRLKEEGFWVRCVDRKYNEYSDTKCDELIIGDLRNSSFVSKVMFAPKQESFSDNVNSFDEVYALMAEMGGAFFVFSKSNDADIIHNSAIMNLHVANYASIMNVKKIFYSSSACCYSESLQMTPDNTGLKESTAWEGGKPDSVYGIEKLFSEQVYDSFRRNKGLNIRVARFHNVFSEEGCWNNGREKFPSACCRKVAETPDGGEIKIMGDGQQTRSFLYCQEALDGIRKLMDSDYQYPVNIGSSEMISINNLAKMVIGISGKNLTIKNVESDAIGVRGRNSDNALIQEVLGWQPTASLKSGMEKLYSWIDKQVNP